MVLSAQHLGLSRRDRCLFSDLSVEIKPSQLWHLHGANGSGKSSLLDVLSGLCQSHQGQVIWYDAEQQPLTPAQAAQRGLFHYCRQQNAVNPQLSVRDNIQRQALWARAPYRQEALQAWAQEVGLALFLDEPAGMLSQGQQKQVALARLRLFPARRLWLLDEPFNSLDQVAVQRLEAWIEAYVAAQGAVIIVSHTEPCVHLSVQRLGLDRPTAVVDLSRSL